MALIPVRSPIADDESTAGYLARLAGYNGYVSGTWILDGALGRGRVAGKTLDSGFWSGDTLKTIINLTGVDEQTLLAKLYRKCSSKVRIYLGNLVPAGMLDPISSKSSRKYCPKCLAEFGFHSSLFDLSLIQICPRHCIRLARHCPHCAEPTVWGSPSIRYCGECKGDLAACTTEQLAVTDMIGLWFLATEIGFQHFILDGCVHHGKWPEQLDHLSFADKVELVLSMAFHLETNLPGARPLYYSRDGQDRVHTALNDGLKYLWNWPEGLFRYLDDLKERRRATAEGARFGLTHDFGTFYSVGMHKEREPWATLKPFFQEYLRRHWDGFARRSASWERHDSDDARVVDLKGACRLLGRSPPKIKALVDAGIINAKRAGENARAPTLFRADDLTKLLSKSEPPIDFKTAAQRLGVSREALNKIARAGVLTPLLGPSVDGSKTYLISVEQVDTITSDILSNLKSLSRGKSHSFGSVMKTCSLYKIPIQLMIRAMRSGALPPCDAVDSQQGLQALRFCRHRMKTWMYDALFDETSTDVFVPVWAAAKFLNVSTMTVLALVADHKLKSLQEATSREYLQLCRRSILDFKENFLRSHDLAKEYGTSLAALLRALAKAGVWPLRYMFNDGSSVSFFERRVINHIDIGQALEDAYRSSASERSRYRRRCLARKRTASKAT
ncbi:TniQ family protein [Microvirga sp. 17 mud 1-3]|uniref:TniQ family protein n=1 Tax=Microvirga sp. 17 mud 1-3 TaxID=2082949 RepID=UPI0013A58578|nr:TniQ family protein [Microvirga sp. 17 mud 1-3]